MKKLYKLVSMELQNSPGGPAIQLRFIDWHPSTEPVNPAREKLQKTLEAVKGKVPEEIATILKGFGEMASESTPQYHMSMSYYSYSTSVVTVNPKEYEEMGRPILGTVFELELRKSEETE